MQNSAYEAMQMMQERHWWWRGMRRLYGAALRLSLPGNLDPSWRVVDVGCGFGANLPVLKEYGDVVGVDVSLEALRAIESRPRLGLVQARADALPFRADSFKVVALLAVVEHVDDDAKVVTEAYRVSKPGSVEILLTSAFMLLWSHHDVANGHRRRYRTDQIDRLQAAVGWKVLQTSYMNAAIFPAVALVRFVQRRMKPSGSSEYDMGPTGGPLNRFLELLLRLEVWLVIDRRFHLPFGVDVFSLARRDD